jgi:hypothetical protein
MLCYVMLCYSTLCDCCSGIVAVKQAKNRHICVCKYIFAFVLAVLNLLVLLPES